VNQQSRKLNNKHTYVAGMVTVLGLVLLIGALFAARNVLPQNSAKAASPAVASYNVVQETGFIEAGIRSAASVADAPASLSSPSRSSIDIGAGYVLVNNSGEWSIVAPSTQEYAPARPAVDISKPLDIGAGYVLAFISGRWTVVAPNTQEYTSVPTTGDMAKSIDIGAGYVLTNKSGLWTVVAPITQNETSARLMESTDVYPTRVDIGSGYVLVMGSDGSGKIEKASP